MLGRRSLTDMDLLCPQCSDIYCLPVILICGHNICRVCLYKFWEVRRCRKCPVCGTESAPGLPPINLALQDAVEGLKGQNAVKDSDKCGLHNEKLKIFCNNDEEPICLVCQLSKQHKMHKCCPVDEAASTKKAEISDLLESLKRKRKTMTKTKQQWEETKTYLKTQSSQIKEAIKEEFQKLHQFLRDEENMRLRVLKQEEETKVQVMSAKLEKIQEQIKTLSSTISSIEKTLNAQDLPFLKGYKLTKKRAKDTFPEPESVRDILIDSSKHLGLLGVNVWKKMLHITTYTPIILDPNTAHSNLKLSRGLTSVQYSARQLLPDNPERCTNRMCLLGANGFTSGKHRWTVEVGQGKEWFVGVARESIKRKTAVFLSPAEGFWVIGDCTKDSVWAQTSPRTKIMVKQKPDRITVELDYGKGKVVFINNEDSTVIHTFKDKFSEKIFPFFALGLCDDWKNSTPLTICPVGMKVDLE